MATIAVSGTKLTRNGQLFLPVGWNSVAGLYAPPNSTSRAYVNAYNQFTSPPSPTCTAMRDWNTNTIRFQVVQNMINNTTPVPFKSKTIKTYGQHYRQRIQAAVGVAERAGFAVILCMQDNLFAPAGSRVGQDTRATGIPTAVTTAAWATLAPMFRNDLNVMFELYNEIHLTTTDWITPVTGWQAVNQGLANTIRRYAPSNVILAGGVDKNLDFTGAVGDLLTGTNIAYSIHPYNYVSAGTGAGYWDGEWGWIVNGGYAPVLATEWYSDGGTNDPSFFNYCHAKGTGIVAWVFDNLGDPVSLLTTTTQTDITKPWRYKPTAAGKPFFQWCNSLPTVYVAGTHESFAPAAVWSR